MKTRYCDICDTEIEDGDQYDCEDCGAIVCIDCLVTDADTDRCTPCADIADDEDDDEPEDDELPQHAYDKHTFTPGLDIRYQICRCGTVRQQES